MGEVKASRRKLIQTDREIGPHLERQESKSGKREKDMSEEGKGREKWRKEKEMRSSGLSRCPLSIVLDPPVIALSQPRSIVHPKAEHQQ